MQACLCGAFGVAVGAERRDRVTGRAETLAHLRAQRPGVGGVRVNEDYVRRENVALRLRAIERDAIDEERLRVRLLEVEDGLDHRLELRLDVVRLVDREADAALERTDFDKLEEDAEELERIDRADDQVVVAVLAVVEMEAAEGA